MANNKAPKLPKEKTTPAPQTKTEPVKAPEQARQPSPATPPATAASVADAPAAPAQAPAAPSTGVRMPTINDVRVAGRLTRDPIIRDVGNQKVANFDIAVEKKYLDAKNVWQKQVSFVPCAVWGIVADRASSFLKKGSPVYLEGRLRSQSWQTKDGQKRSIMRLEAFKVQSLARGQARSQGQEVGD
jgi:single-strand DNA-binding protein